MGVALCQDRPGVDRVAVQRDLLKGIVDFVRLDNEPASVAAQPGAPSKANARFTHSNSFFQICSIPRRGYLPCWGLCVLGLMQARTRAVAVWVALILPAAMLILSLSGVVQYVGLWIPALLTWALGVGASSILLLRSADREAARYETESGKLVVAGSWIPLLVILGIFSVRHAMGVARGMELQIVQDRSVQLAVSFVLGALSGFFLSRGLLYWRIYAPRSEERPSAS